MLFYCLIALSWLATKQAVRSLVVTHKLFENVMTERLFMICFAQHILNYTIYKEHVAVMYYFSSLS